MSREQSLFCFFIGIFGLVVMAFIVIHQRKQKLKEARKKAGSEPVFCPYCGGKEHPYGDPDRFFECFECQRHFVSGRSLTAEEQRTVREEEADVAEIAGFLPDVQMFEIILDAVRSVQGFVGATVTVYRDKAECSVQYRTPFSDPFHPESKVVETDPVRLPYTIRTNAGRALYLKSLGDYINREYGASLQAQHASDYRHLGILVKD